MAYVCITGSEKKPKDLVARVAKVLEASPRILCELRLDYLQLSPEESFAFLEQLPEEWAPRLVLTMRLKASGITAMGNCTWDVQTWQAWWKQVMALRAWFAVDLDWIVLDELAGESLNWGGKFRSRHAFFSVHLPLDEVARALPELESSARHHNAGIKIAAPVTGARDLAYFARITKDLQDHPLKIVIAMGDAGKAWRWSRLAGNLSYFAYSADERTASGQDLFENVLPYTRGKPIPELFILWSDDPHNHHGEREWNRLFEKRGWNARFINVACRDAPLSYAPIQEKKNWSHCALDWMEMAKVQGAAVTKPFKEYFPLAIPGTELRAINTIHREDNTWAMANTDGGGVSNLLERCQVKKVVILGGGGAGKGVADALRTDNFEVQLISRNAEGALPTLPSSDCLISTWPHEYQAELVKALRSQQYTVPIVLDAQLKLTDGSAPLALWAKEKKFPYLSGIHWWKEQAKLQDEIWFSTKRGEAIRKKILPHIPSSKSETLRALAIAAFFPGETKIIDPAICQDTEMFLHALEELGLVCEREDALWTIHGGKKLRANSSPIFIGEGAAPLRFLGALSAVIEGESLCIDAAPSLRKRPVDELFQALGLAVPKSWPITIPCGLALPKEVSVTKSSQFASGFLLAGAAELWLKRKKEVSILMSGELRSEPYLLITRRMLEESGIHVEVHGAVWNLCLAHEPHATQEIHIEKDATGIANFEVLSLLENLGSLLPNRRAKEGEQGDWCFNELLANFFATDKAISLKDAPDLAPSFFVASVLFRKRLEIKDAPQLHDKECDRARAIVKMAKLLGIEAEERTDGFLVDASHFHPPLKNMILPTEGDHRMAMAVGALAHVFPTLKADNEACVAKSFPKFWIALETFKDLLP